MTVLVNQAAGTVPDEAAGRLEASLRASGVQAEIRCVAPQALEPEARQAARAADTDAVVAAGGDGTISTVAAALAGGEKPLGLLPLGTLNHFARDLGVPTDLEAAGRVIGAGLTREVDLGEVNGRFFINNCSIGLYPEAVRWRELRRRWRGERKWRAMAAGALQALRRFPLLRLTMRAEGASRRLVTPLLMVGNNRYEMELLRIGKRSALDEGLLWVYLTRTTGPAGVLRLALRALVGRLEQARDFEALATELVELQDRRRRRALLAAIDGELVELESPLRLRSLPRALRVLVPAET